MSNLEKATRMATDAHFGQKRHDGITPYISHPRAVARILEDWQLDEKHQIVGVLHDVIEDTKLTADDLRKAGFSTEIVEAIVAISKVEGEDYDVYLKRVINNRLAKVVKLADLTHNLSDLKKGSLRDKYLSTKLLLETVIGIEVHYNFEVTFEK